jgi:hypothetical protein
MGTRPLLDEALSCYRLLRLVTIFIPGNVFGVFYGCGKSLKLNKLLFLLLIFE